MVASEPFDPSTLALFEAPVAEEAQPNLIQWVDRQAAAAEALDCVRKLLVEAAIFEHPEDVNDLLAGLWQTQDDQALADWQVAVARYEGSETFILPYAGNYCRAYLVEFLSPLATMAGTCSSMPRPTVL